MNTLPIWLLYLALAVPLSFLASAVLRTGFEFQSRVNAAANMPSVVTDEATGEDGAVYKTIQVSVPTAAYVTVTARPISIRAHARVWAAVVLLTGMILVGAGIAGLFHLIRQNS